MGILNVSFRCIDNVVRELEDRQVCYATTLYEATFEVPKIFERKEETVDQSTTRAAHKMKPARTTSDYLRKQIRKQLKAKGLPKKIFNANIVITYMWDEYALAENNSLV